MKRLSLSIQTFSEIIKKEYPYIDKTQHLAELIPVGKYLFWLTRKDLDALLDYVGLRRLLKFKEKEVE